MHDYELMVILDPDIDERTVAPSLEGFLEVIRQSGGTVENLDIWGKRRLSYEINKKSEGIYAVANFTSSPEATTELDRQLHPATLLSGKDTGIRSEAGWHKSHPRGSLLIEHRSQLQVIDVGRTQ